jgi:hypothetical protein
LRVLLTPSNKRSSNHNTKRKAPAALFGIENVVQFGYQVRAVGKGRKHRKPLNEVAYRGRFGQPFE